MNPAVAAVSHEVDAATPRRAPRRGHCSLLSAVVRQRASALRRLPAANTIRAHMHIASSCHDDSLPPETRYAALLPDGDSGAALAAAGAGVAGSGVASVRLARSG